MCVKVFVFFTAMFTCVLQTFATIEADLSVFRTAFDLASYVEAGLCLASCVAAGLCLAKFAKMYDVCEPIKAKAESIIKWYTPNQWALLISLTCTLIISLAAAGHVALYADSYQMNAEDVLDAHCKPSAKVYTFGAVFLAGALLNFKSILGIPLI